VGGGGGGAPPHGSRLSALPRSAGFLSLEGSLSLGRARRQRMASPSWPRSANRSSACASRPSPSGDHKANSGRSAVNAISGVREVMTHQDPIRPGGSGACSA
jgi:hypothetical protein